jgi:2-isopropylmalate synthase
MILNLPATVEIAMPNVYADQIEWMLQNIAHRESFIISLHTHNDRGTAVAASELGLLAGAERVEGTLFGNGERTGNVDIITLALNLFSQGIAPQLDFGNINQIAETYEKCTRIPVHKRHPYAGELVYTAFSGSHQDAIAKGMAFREQMLHKNSAPENMPHSFWEVPYLPIDPKDLGRNYEAIIRLNSQSGKGGAAYILKKYFGIDLPKNMHPEFSSLIQARADVAETEIKPALVYQIFEDEYLNQNQPLSFQNFKSIYENGSDAMQCELFIEKAGETIKLAGNGNGPIDACKGALNQILEKEFSIESYTEHSLSKGSDSRAIAFIEVKNYQGKSYFGAGLDTNITKASVKALICALNRNLVGG